ncbi:hypothetical protein BAUCODRAFT_150875 [Baudoinia panamericana UAMH 10762]|uniref:TFIIS N-terminal domain-containing protein n=1 Tax=Baudoinia panamericana (strain UAMH 10762) TaxID=717646 RepID=M2LHE2_BAUPA|nr:uncharacterized protein BAUCODRAFT_150875 [Baudoinia panamericana UAMH 10762]EMC93567.1 hypothetical protein BAUCODRAFT_150875 [Baudoinia panamericana UAMH 10762]
MEDESERELGPLAALKEVARRIKDAVVDDEPASTLLSLLLPLRKVVVSHHLLLQTSIGLAINRVRCFYKDPAVGEVVDELRAKWHAESKATRSLVAAEDAGQGVPLIRSVPQEASRWIYEAVDDSVNESTAGGVQIARRGSPVLGTRTVVWERERLEIAGYLRTVEEMVKEIRKFLGFAVNPPLPIGDLSEMPLADEKIRKSPAEAMPALQSALATFTDGERTNLLADTHRGPRSATYTAEDSRRIAAGMASAVKKAMESIISRVHHAQGLTRVDVDAQERSISPDRSRLHAAEGLDFHYFGAEPVQEQEVDISTAELKETADGKEPIPLTIALQKFWSDVEKQFNTGIGVGRDDVQGRLTIKLEHSDCSPEEIHVKAAEVDEPKDPQT